uniref:Uncharacterized protein n=1 Tax=Terrapene triunguis TaxID=2587831 RepID=A0A674J6V5_9SAUR
MYFLKLQPLIFFLFQQGSICSDFCTTLWCGICSLCQLKRDINIRKEMGIF